MSGRPTDLDGIAASVGISRVEHLSIPVDAALVREGKERVVLVSNSASRRRQRYSLAHEIAHVVLGTEGQSCFTLRSGRNSAERDADGFAAELLMPESEVRQIVERDAVGFAALRRLALSFGVSLEAMALRLCELALTDSVFIRWEVFGRPGSGDKLRVAWSCAPAGSRIWIPRYATSRTLSERVAASPRGSGPIRLQLGTLRGIFALEWLVAAPVVLSLVSLGSIPVTAGRARPRIAPAS